MSRAGYVLVGGESSRMGRDKAFLEIGDVPLASHVAALVQAAAGRVVLVGHPERYGTLPYAAIADRESGLGPLAGVVTALEHTTEDWNLIVACDMPAVSIELFEMLFEEAEAGNPDALVPVSPAGRPEPLCAIYHRRCLPVLEAALAQGRLKMRAALENLHVVPRPIPAGERFVDTNTPEECPK